MIMRTSILTAAWETERVSPSNAGQMLVSLKGGWEIIDDIGISKGK